MRDTWEVVTAAQWARVMKAPPGSIDEDFFAAGGDSLKAARLAGALRAVTGRKVDLGLIFEVRTVRLIAAWFRQDATASGQVVTLSSQGDKAPLVLLPSGGGGVVGLHGLGAAPLGRPVHALLARGLQAGDDDPPELLDAWVDDFVKVLVSSALPRRIHLGGFCAGGILAVEVARRLLEDDWQVLSVNLFNTTLDNPPTDADELMQTRLRHLIRSAGAEPGNEVLSAEQAYALLQAAPDADMVEADFDAFSRRLRVTAWLSSSVGGYRPAPVAVPVRLFSTPDRNDPADVAELGTPPDWPDIGFADFAVHHTPVGHFQLLHDSEVLSTLGAELDRCDG